MAGLRVSYILFIVAGSLFLLFVAGCSSGHRNIPPHEINFNGIRLYLSKDQALAIIPALKCSPVNSNSDTCLWILPAQQRTGNLRSIDRIKLIFRDDKLKVFHVYYSQLLDFEFNNLEKNVRQKYGYPLKDTMATDWKYDSLRITLTTNRREHWTRKFRIFTPELEFREEIED
jgi:hypothetical protein